MRFTFQNKPQNVFHREVISIHQHPWSTMLQFFSLLGGFDQLGDELPARHLQLDNSARTDLEVFRGELSVRLLPTHTALRSHTESVLGFQQLHFGFDLDRLDFSLQKFVGLEGKFCSSDDIEVTSCVILFIGKRTTLFAMHCNVYVFAIHMHLLHMYLLEFCVSCC